MIEDMGDRELKLSVIVPMYNAEEYLKECLESIEKSIQGLEAEVLLIDDGSEDRTSDIALAFQHEHSRFRYYRKENGGPADAKNYGIGKAKGKYLAFTDSDDLVTESMYHNMVRAAEYHSDGQASLPGAGLGQAGPGGAALHPDQSQKAI